MPWLRREAEGQEVTFAELMLEINKGQPFPTAEVVADIDGTLCEVRYVGVAVNMVRLVVAVEDE